MYYECGICGHLHSVKWDGDCREDKNRFTMSQLEDVGVNVDDPNVVLDWVAFLSRFSTLAAGVAKPRKEFRMELPNYRVKFRCPNPQCNGEHFEEHLIEVTHDSEILEVQPFVARENPDQIAAVVVEYGDASTDGGEVDEYRCMVCGYALRDEHESPIINEVELFAWLKDHDMLGETISEVSEPYSGCCPDESCSGAVINDDCSHCGDQWKGKAK